MGEKHLSQVTLSDGLQAIIETFEAKATMGLVLTRSDVKLFLDGFYAMRDEARHLETIADRAQWNAKARRDALRLHNQEISDAIAGSDNVTRFPVAGRPATVEPRGDEGGAA